MLNRRLSFLIIKGFWGNAKVGVYNATSQVSESPQMIGISIAMVQFSKISNLNDNSAAVRITIQLLKIATSLTAICIFVACIIPTSVYSWLFTSNFAAMRVVMISLAPGVVFQSARMVLSHYFSGVNMPKHNLYGALVGLAVTIPSLYFLIPPFGMVGAGISASLTHLSIMLYQWIVFKKHNNVSVKELLVTKDDVKLFVSEVKAVLGK
jgi:O-antigen/teichoic acid export membrane protein